MCPQLLLYYNNAAISIRKYQPQEFYFAKADSDASLSCNGVIQKKSVLINKVGSLAFWLRRKCYTFIVTVV